MMMQREMRGLQTVYKLKDDVLNEAIGEAVISEGEDGFRLHGIFVKPKFRGKGYGSFIMKAILTRARNKRVSLCTGFGNVSFFERFGFKVTNVGEALVYMEREPQR
jgi:GNAT superfamily N-acetyltransferase